MGNPDKVEKTKQKNGDYFFVDKYPAWICGMVEETLEFVQRALWTVGIRDKM